MKKSKLINEERVSNGFLNISKLTLETPLMNKQGSMTQVREVAVQNNSVFVLLYDKKTEECLVVKQHRPGAIFHESTIVLEPVAGRLDRNSHHSDIAIAEIHEEAGLKIEKDKLNYIGEFFSSPGGSTESCHCYVALCDLSSVPKVSYNGLESEGEDIETVKIDVKSIEKEPSNKSMQLIMLVNYARLNY